MGAFARLRLSVCDGARLGCFLAFRHNGLDREVNAKIGRKGNPGGPGSHAGHTGDKDVFRLVLLGIAVMGFKGQLGAVAAPRLTLPTLTSFRPAQVWDSLVLGGFAQIPLTATNAIIACAALTGSGS